MPEWVSLWAVIYYPKRNQGLYSWLLPENSQGEHYGIGAKISPVRPRWARFIEHVDTDDGIMNSYLTSVSDKKWSSKFVFMDA